MINALIQLGDGEPATNMKELEKLVCLAYLPVRSKIQNLKEARYFLFNKHTPSVRSISILIAL